MLHRWSTYIIFGIRMIVKLNRVFILKLHFGKIDKNRNKITVYSVLPT